MNFGELLTASQMDGGIDDPKKKKPVPTMADEMKVLYKKPFKYDNKSALDITRNVAAKTGIDPSILYSSAFQEGMNKVLANPDEVEKTLQKGGWFNKDYPVSGYESYGLDTFGQRFDEFVQKGYLPPEFKDQFTPINIFNDHVKQVKNPKTGKIEMVDDPQAVVSADFKNNEAALMAKSAFIRSGQDAVKNYAKQKGVTLDNDTLNYFTLAAYNSGEGNAMKMFDKYVSSKDKKEFIEKGDANWQSVHKNISPRMQNAKVVNQLFAENPLG